MQIWSSLEPHKQQNLKLSKEKSNFVHAQKYICDILVQKH
jgi:hypothetical protein